MVRLRLGRKLIGEPRRAAAVDSGRCQRARRDHAGWRRDFVTLSGWNCSEKPAGSAWTACAWRTYGCAPASRRAGHPGAPSAAQPAAGAADPDPHRRRGRAGHAAGGRRARRHLAHLRERRRAAPQDRGPGPVVRRDWSGPGNDRAGDRRLPRLRARESPTSSSTSACRCS
jgi:hypothetical protein